MVRANLNECPYPPPERVLQAAGGVDLNRYPDPGRVRILEELYADYAGVEPEYVKAIPGSDTVLELAWMALRPERLLALHPGFHTLTGIAGWVDPGYRPVPVALDGREPLLDGEALLRLLGPGKLLAADDPSNPLGARSLPERLPPDLPGMLLVDEAYYEYTGYTHVGEAVGSNNILVARTMSKAFSLASARVGFIITGAADLLRRDPLPFRIPASSVEAAIAALEDPGYAKECARLVNREADRLAGLLMRAGLRVARGRAPFLLVYTGDPEAPRLLARRGVLVSHFPQIEPGAVRISPQTPRENDYIVDVMTRLSDERGWSGR